MRPSLRETAAMMLATEVYCLDGFGSPEKALEFARKLLDSADTEPLWSDGKHAGDCTRQPFTCSRCLREKWEEKAREEFADLDCTKHWFDAKS